MKFTDEELSRVLSAHEDGTLERGGGLWSCSDTDYAACILQVAKLVPHPFDACVFNEKLAYWFDDCYEPGWTAVRFFRELEKQGVA